MAGRAVLRAAERGGPERPVPASRYEGSAEFLPIDPGIEPKKKRRPSDQAAFLYFSILAVTYVPASLPTQYHRPGEA